MPTYDINRVYILKYYGISKICDKTADGAAIHLFLTHTPQKVATIAHVTFAKCGVLDNTSVLSIGPGASQYHSGICAALLSSGVLPLAFHFKALLGNIKSLYKCKFVPVLI